MHHECSHYTHTIKKKRESERERGQERERKRERKRERERMCFLQMFENRKFWAANFFLLVKK